MAQQSTKLVLGITAPQSVDLLSGQLSYFRSQGYRVHLLAPETAQVLEFCAREHATLLPIDIKRNLNPFADLRTLIQVYFILKRVRPQVLNLGTPKVSLLGMIAGSMSGVPVRIYTCRGLRFEHERGVFRRLLKGMERMIGRCAHKVVCISPSIKQLAQQEKLFKADKMVCIGKGSSNGINLARFNPAQIQYKDRRALKHTYGLDDYFIFGYVGRLVDRKGVQELYEAFDQFYKDNQAIRLLVVGRPYWDQIRDKSLITRFEQHPGIIMTGLQPPESIPGYLSVMDVFVLPAWWEGFGNVLIQAAAMGVPVISTLATGCRDAVADQFNGVLIASHSAPALESAMRTFADDPLLLERYGQNGILWSKNFTPEIIWKGLHQLYTE